MSGASGSPRIELDANRRSAAAERAHATWMLFFATVVWGLSFPLTKAFFYAQEIVIPGRNSWFHSSFLLVARFFFAALFLVLAAPGLCRGITRREWEQGIGVGVFAALGLLLQADGLAYTSASTSAFLTQLYCVFIPLIIAVRRLQIPSGRMIVSCFIVFLGVGVLAGLDWSTLRLGRGEIETILSSFFFTAQIIWLSRGIYRGNDARRTTLVMFGAVTLLLFPALLQQTRDANDLLASLTAPFSVALILALTIFCTLVAFAVMNRWQRHLEATRAGLIYCAEPVFASLFALFLPGWFSVFGAFDYPNERATLNLIVGGSLITLANLLVLREGASMETAPAARNKHSASQDAPPSS